MDTILFACLWFSMGFLAGVVYVIASLARHRARRTVPRPRGQAVKIVGNHTHRRQSASLLPDVDPKPWNPA